MIITPHIQLIYITFKKVDVLEIHILFVFSFVSQKKNREIYILYFLNVDLYEKTEIPTLLISHVAFGSPDLY